nr:penicillin-binding transpeptidase domain-containing protein [Thermoanaerobaculia bacterium]
GNRIHGIAYAARRYLAKPVADLSWAEIAFLTAIPQSPARMNPFDPLGRGRAIERGRRILDQLAEDGVLDSVEHQTALEEIERIAVPPRGQRPPELLHALLHWSETLGTPEARRARGAGLILDTTLDLELEKQVTSEAQEAVAEWQHLGAGNAAVLVVEKGSREVLAAVGSTGYFDREHAGAIDYLRVPRLAGSTLKPFVYALALERGQLSPSTPLDDLEPAVGGIVNADSRFLGPLPPRFALANSRNVPAANLLAELGVEQGYGFLTDLGLADGQVPASTYGVGLAVGGMPVTLEALTTAYTVLAGDGRLAPLVWLQGEPAARPRRMLSEETARELTLFLADPQARLPTFPRMGASEYPFPVAVKTGTSSHYRDAWAMAWSRRYLVGVWVGHPDYRPMAELSGYRSAARLAQQVMRRLHPGELDGLSDSSFPPPRGYHAERLCALSGGRATPACDRVFLEWLPPGSFPGPCTFHRQVVLDRRTGRPAVGKVPERQRELATFLDLPPRYAAWARSQGLEQRFGPSAPGAALASFVPAPGGP